jgi:signal transduction histidine kinase
MNTLRVRIALVFVLLILAVEGSILGAALLVLGPPGPPHSIDPLARQVVMLAGLAATAPQPTPFVSPTPDVLRGAPEPALTDWLRQALRGLGSDLAARVERPASPGPFVVAVPIEGRGWLEMPMPDLPPPGGFFRPLLVFLFVVTSTAVTVALLAAYRITKPLALLENAVANVGQGTMLPELPERGPAEVKATAAALNRLSARLRSAVESRMRLVAAAGHDLRTPMTRMRLRAEFLAPEERVRWLADIEELDRIADSAIALVREEVAPEATSTLWIDELAKSVLRDLSAQGLKVDAGPIEPAAVCAGRLALSRALRNLVINAATHGGGATVCVKNVGRMLCLTVDDDGAGIPDAQLARALEPFYRADPARGQIVPGAGLGLSIANEIITRAGGELILANRRPHGLRAEVRLPLVSIS